MAARIYLAGPEVFFADPAGEASRLKEICSANGLVGCFPTDADYPKDNKMSSAEKIYLGNVRLIDSCDAIIANMSPFRGISMDPGTVFEIGYAVAQGKPIFGWSLAHAETYSFRIKKAKIEDGMHVEDYGITDNLMLVMPLSDQRVHSTFGDAAASAGKLLDS